MKSLKRKDFITAGVIERLHGTKGELRLQLSQNIRLKEWVFFEIQEKPVPFFIQSVSENKDSPIIKIEDIDTPNHAARFVGLNILFPSKQVKGRSKISNLDFIGYKLIDETLGEIGKVEDVEELPQQLLIKTTHNNRELLIPAVDEFIIEINDKKKIIYLNLPEGLIAL